ncbi:hypothetical protein ACKLLE_08040, partial [Pseudomonas bharatica]
RTYKAGDQLASIGFTAAAAIAAGSALTALGGSIASTSVLLFPLAVAVFLGFVGFGFAVWAKKQESQPLEMWARHSLWGLPEDHRRWKDSYDMDTAIGALNAALLGFTAELDVTVRIQRPGDKVSGRGGTMEYQVVLPGYTPDLSHYEWELWGYRPGETSGGIIVSGRTGSTDPLSASDFWKRSGYETDTTAPIIDYDAESRELRIKGCVAFRGNLDFHALQLIVTYWPNKSDEAGVARLTTREDKISGWLGWKSYEKS